MSARYRVVITTGGQIAREYAAILCEKPMAVSLGEADAMLIACQRNHVKPWKPA